LRWRWNRSTDTPLPPEEPAGENPPDGAIIDYELPVGVSEATLQIFDSGGKLVRKYSSRDQPPVTEAQLRQELNVPTYWVRPFVALSSAPGFHRFVWDLHTAPPLTAEHNYSMAAIYHDTPREPQGVYVTPGTYRAELVVDGKSYSRTFELKMDPRIKTSAADLQKQFTLSESLYKIINQSAEDSARAEQLAAHLKEAAEKASGTLKTKLENTQHEVEDLLHGDGRNNFGGLTAQALRVYEILQGSDNAPTSQAESAVEDISVRFRDLAGKWEALKNTKLAALNKEVPKAETPDKLKTADKDADDDEP
jgi:hypothetical protein